MKKYIESIIEQGLQSDFNMLVLRGIDSQARAEGDIDVLVPYGMSNTACKILVERVKKDGLNLVGFRELDYLSSVIIANISTKPHTAIKIDFFGGIEWYGVRNNKQSSTNNLFEKINIASTHEANKQKAVATVTFLHKVMYAGKFRARDISRIQPYSEHIRNLLGWPSLIDTNFVKKGQISRIAKWKIRFKVSGYQKKEAPLWALKILYRSVKSRIRYSRYFGQYISFSGLDPANQEVHFNQLKFLYMSAGDTPPKTFKLSSSIVDSIKQIHASTRSLDSKPWRPQTIGSLQSSTRLLWFLITAYIFRHYCNLITWRGNNIITYQSIIDVAANPYILQTYNIPQWSLPFIIPRGHYILLSLKREEISFQEENLTDEQAEKIISNYKNIFRQLKGVIIDGSKSPEDIFSSIINHLDHHYSLVLGSST